MELLIAGDDDFCGNDHWYMRDEFCRNDQTYSGKKQRKGGERK